MKTISKILVVFLMMTLAAAENQCGPRQYYSECGTNCPATCEYPNPTICDLACNIDQRCFCKEGFVQISETDTTCVPVDSCPQNRCGPRQHYSECGTSCPATCENPNPTMCILMCNIDQRCFCNEGFVQISETDTTCVRVDRCPQNQCGPRQHYSECGTNCPATCENPDPTICNYACNIDQLCFCKEGFVQKSETDTTCVRVERCPQNQCGPNQVYNKCGTNCPENCEERDPQKCNKACNIKQRCYCKPGYVERSRTDKTCIPVDSCPKKKCGPNQFYTDCGTNCPATCDDRYPAMCNTGCNGFQHCFCNDGFVQISEFDTTCVPVDRCQKQQCAPNQFYTDCGTNCPATCEEPNPELCNTGCNKKQTCYCKEGFVQISDSDTTCVPVDSCSKQQCGPNQFYTDCGTNCPATCGDRYPAMCNTGCNGYQHCFCNDGFVQISVFDTTCVPVDSCKKQQCGPNQFYTECGTNCPATCEYPHPELCNTGCNKKQPCYCKEGFVQISDSDTACVPVDKCPGN